MTVSQDHHKSTVTVNNKANNHMGRRAGITKHRLCDDELLQNWGCGGVQHAATASYFKWLPTQQLTWTQKLTSYCNRRRQQASYCMVCSKLISQPQHMVAMQPQTFPQMLQVLPCSCKSHHTQQRAPCHLVCLGCAGCIQAWRACRSPAGQQMDHLCCTHGL